MNAFKTYYIDVLKNNYFNFEGRATRKQYWLFFLFNFIIVMILGIFAGMDNFIGTLFGILYALYSLAVILPNLSIGARRLHDRNLSGWWQLLVLLPLVGSLILLILFVLPGTPGQNRFDK